jgi:large subunit ribosomal protein L2
MCSGEIRFLPVGALATVGTVSNPFHRLEILGTAGANRRKGRRPAVRGVAMNPVDHPMGGQGGGRGVPSTSPWGKITKGVFTVKKHLQKMVIKARPTRNARKKQIVRKHGKFALLPDDFSTLEIAAPNQ